MTTRSITPLVAFLTSLCVAIVWAQTPPHSGGLTPFRDPNLGRIINLPTLVLNDREDCPLVIKPSPLTRASTGDFVLSYTVTNRTDEPIRSHTIRSWIVAPDGTLKGFQDAPSDGTLARGKSKKREHNLRPGALLPEDCIVLAVQQAVLATGQWERDAEELEAAVNKVVAGGGCHPRSAPVR